MYAVSVQPSMAVAICISPLAMQQRIDRPPDDAKDARVMVAARGRVIGCATFTGVVTLEGRSDYRLEHRNAGSIRTSIASSRDHFGPCLWVFEDGLLFSEAFELGTDRCGVWPIPNALLADLRSVMQPRGERSPRSVARRIPCDA